MLNANGPGFENLCAGDSVRFVAQTGIGLRGPEYTERTARVLPLLVFTDHVQVAYGPHGHTVNASNFVRRVRRGRRAIQLELPQ
jgi:hypothetical protein